MLAVWATRQRVTVRGEEAAHHYSCISSTLAILTISVVLTCRRRAPVCASPPQPHKRPLPFKPFLMPPLPAACFVIMVFESRDFTPPVWLELVLWLRPPSITE